MLMVVEIVFLIFVLLKMISGDLLFSFSVVFFRFLFVSVVILVLVGIELVNEILVMFGWVMSLVLILLNF